MEFSNDLHPILLPHNQRLAQAVKQNFQLHRQVMWYFKKKKPQCGAASSRSPKVFAHMIPSLSRENVSAEKVQEQRRQHTHIARVSNAGYSASISRICDTLSKHINMSKSEMHKQACSFERGLRLSGNGLAPLGLTYGDRRDFCL